MSVTLSAKTVPITSTRSNTDDVRARPSSTSGVPRDTGPLGEHAESLGADEITEIHTGGVRPSASAEVPGLTRANLRRLEGKDPAAAALASIVSSMPPSETTPTAGIKVANAKVNVAPELAPSRFVLFSMYLPFPSPPHARRFCPPSRCRHANPRKEHSIKDNPADQRQSGERRDQSLQQRDPTARRRARGNTASQSMFLCVPAGRDRAPQHTPTTTGHKTA